MNIHINIMGHEGKRFERGGLVKAIRCVQRCKCLRLRVS